MSTPTGSATRLRNQAPDSSSAVLDGKPRTKAINLLIGKKRPAQDDKKDNGPPTKRTAVSGLPLKSSMKTGFKSSGDAHEANRRLMEAHRKRQQAIEAAQEIKAGETTAPHKKPALDKSTALRIAREAPPLPSLAIPDKDESMINHAGSLNKNTCRRVTFVPTPYKPPSRLPRTPTRMRNLRESIQSSRALHTNPPKQESDEPLTSAQLQSELDEATPLNPLFPQHASPPPLPTSKTPSPSQPQIPSVLTSDPSRPITTQDLESFFEPLPRSTDQGFEDRYKQLKSACWAWCKTHFSQAAQAHSAYPASDITLTDLVRLSKSSPELMEIVGFIASPDSDKGWEDVFNERRACLVYGVLGKVLEVHVFGHEMFGCSEGQLGALRGVDLEMVDADAFTRHQLRSTTISSFLAHPTPHLLPPLYLPHLALLTRSVVALLSPLLPPSTSSSTPYTPHLSSLLLHATHLSLSLRRQPSTIYLFTPAPAKRTVLDPSETHALNARGMAKQVRRLGGLRVGGRKWEAERGERELGKVIRIACWPSLTAYRRGGVAGARKRHRAGNSSGGSSSSSSTTSSSGEDASADEDTSSAGFTTRLIGRAEVVCELVPLSCFAFSCSAAFVPSSSASSSGPISASSVSSGSVTKGLREAVREVEREEREKGMGMGMLRGKTAGKIGLGVGAVIVAGAATAGVLGK